MRDTEFSADINATARNLAYLRYTTDKRKDTHTNRISSDRRMLLAAYKCVYAANKSGEELPGGAHILLDNFFIAEKHLNAIDSMQRTENAGKHSRLPIISEGARAGDLRIYALCDKFLSLRDYNYSESAFIEFVDAYQTISPLSADEIEKLSETLSIIVLKKLRECAYSAVSEIAEYERASRCFGELKRYEMNARRCADILNTFVAQAQSVGIYRLYTMLSDSDRFSLITQLNSVLSTYGKNIENENAYCRARQQLNHNATVNVIATLKALDSYDADHMRRALSIVDRILASDELYTCCDITTKRTYAEIIKRLANKLHVTEAAVAMRAVELSKEQNEHVAKFFIDDNAIAALSHSLRPEKRFLTHSQDERLNLFIMLQVITTLIFCVPVIIWGWWQVFLCIIPAFAVANALIIRFTLKRTAPRFIPRLKVDAPLDGSNRTLVVVPTLITDEKAVAQSVEQLEVHYLANPVEGAFFAVLADHTDAHKEHDENDSALLEKAKVLTDALNEKYASPNTPIFGYLYRKRSLNSADGIYMGRERKRGAIMDLIKLIVDDERDAYELISTELPKDIRYMVTVDADTVIPKETLLTLIGAMSHPLNRPVADKYGVVRSGYAIMLPRMENTARSAAKSSFSRLVAGFGGVSSYSGLVGDLYFDVFGEGVFGGKGILDVNAFNTALRYRIKDNTVLSHDLLEGCFARAGYLSDTALYDGEPSSYLAWWKRQHRWIRGDWQLMPYLPAHVTDVSDTVKKTFLSRLSRYKVFDNLRRSATIPIVMLILIVTLFTGWHYYTCLAFTALLIDQFISLFSAICGMLQSGIGKLKDEVFSVCRGLLRVAMLPYEAYVSFDAIIRTVYRVGISHKNLLEWQTAAQAEGKREDRNLWYYCKKLWINLVVGVVYLFAGVAGLHSLPVLGIAFLLAPIAVYLLDLPAREVRLSEPERAELTQLAKKVWNFFETEGKAEHGFTPPDNVQEEPKKPPVYHTSPTNIGMGLMATMSARDLGFITEETMLERFECAVAYIERLEKWNGHLFNWYNIETENKLPPAYISTVDSGNLAACVLTAEAALREITSEQLKCRAEACANRFDTIVSAMNFKALYDEQKKLFHIGFDFENGVLTKSWYDLLASEARLSYFVACALNMIPTKAWFSLGRVLVPIGKKARALASWGGTMFEYLMPVIFTPLTRGTLLDETCKNVVFAQQAYAKERASSEAPWGISESGYYAFDNSFYYQYRAFGVPTLGVAPLREREHVLAPYAVALALMVDKHAAFNGLERFMALSGYPATGKYGFYEAIDFTDARVRPGYKYEVVASYMAHHQGMTICALNNCLNNGVIQKRFSGIPIIRSVMLLTEEKRPSNAVTLKEYESTVFADTGDESANTKRPAGTRVVDKYLKYPQAQVLSNGHYHALIADNGVGYSMAGNTLLNVFRGDYARDSQGIAIAIKVDGDVYTVSPALNTSDNGDGCLAHTVFELHKIELHKRIGKNGDIVCKVEIVLSPEYDAEIRKITVINQGAHSVSIDIGVFMNVALTTREEYAAHPAFVRLSIDAEVANNTLLLHRRATYKRSPLYLYARLTGASQTSYSADRLYFMGRHGSITDAMKRSIIIGGNVSQPIEPGVCARTETLLRAGESYSATYVVGVADTRERALSECEELSGADMIRITDMAWAKAMSTLRFMGISAGKAELFQKIITRLALNVPSKPGKPFSTEPCKDALYKFVISGDYPIIALPIRNMMQLRTLKTLLKFREYADYMGVRFDLAVLGEYENNYSNELRQKIIDMTATSLVSSPSKNVHIIHAYEATPDEINSILALSLIVIDTARTLDRQFANGVMPLAEIKNYTARPSIILPKQELICSNSYGGFSANGDEYVMALDRNVHTPLPWSNIIVNNGFGTLVTETFGGYTWKHNCHENRITPWYNDAVSDMSPEAILISDCDTHEQWTPYHGSLQGDGAVIITHGYGYTRFSSGCSQLKSELIVTVDEVRPIKYVTLKITNPLNVTRKLSARYCIDFEVGMRGVAAVCEFINNAVLVRGTGEYRYIAVKSDKTIEVSYSSDRLDTLMTLSDNTPLNKVCGANCSAFGAIDTFFETAPGETVTLSWLIGADTQDNINSILNEPIVIPDCDSIRRAWKQKTQGLCVHTPDKALDLMVNNRLLYQVYASRLMGRTGYYQSGGAFGFRDQLQDVLALKHTDPDRVKGQILLCASMQFERGDCLHWWHAPAHGVRTRVTDDRLFLPSAAYRYCKATGDWALFDEKAPYLADVTIPEDAADIYFEAKHTSCTSSLYEHCLRAIEATLCFGAHDLPLMGGGDWNDGMDTVGKDGGESVFIAMFLKIVLRDMAEVALKRNDTETHKRYCLITERLNRAVQSSAWNGAWFLRAYFADGTPLGSRDNAACAIDLLVQVFSVFCGDEHAKSAFYSAMSMLFSETSGTLALLSPPFDEFKRTDHSIGYIQGYTAGVRENGGQYTHAAVWAIIAACMLDDDETAYKLFRSINPVDRAVANPVQYKGEPYAVAGDIYTIGNNAGRAGWTWYTGSAAWLYIAATEYILGIKREGATLYISPCNTFDSYSVEYSYGNTVYRIEIVRADVDCLIVDGRTTELQHGIKLTDDGVPHKVIAKHVR